MPCVMSVDPQWVRVDSWSNATDHWKTHGVTLVERVRAGALLLFDGGSFRFAFFDQLSRRGIWCSHVSRICSHADGVFDAIVSLGTDPAHQAWYPVRVIQYWLHGRHARSSPHCARPAHAEAFGRGGLLCAQMEDRASVPGDHRPSQPEPPVERERGGGARPPVVLPDPGSGFPCVAGRDGRARRCGGF